MLRVYIIYKKAQTQLEHAGGPLEFGRGPRRDVPRRVLQDPSVSADQLRIEEIDGSRLRLRNLSRRFPVRLSSGVDLEAGAECEAPLPVRLTMGETLLQVEELPDDGPDDGLQTVARPLRPGESRLLSRLQTPPKGQIIMAETLARWFEAVVSVQRSSASSDEFYRQTARAVVELIGLERGLVLLSKGDDWEVVARHEAAGARGGPEFSRSILARVCRDRRTFYLGVVDASTTTSLLGVNAVVAAPILGDDDRVLGVVYGSRQLDPGEAPSAVSALEAQLVQVLASAVGAGLARISSEADAARRRVQFEQFFSPELARELDRDPSLLEGRDREVTVLFSDIRGFSRLSERLTPRETCQLACDVMDRLTERVREHGGVVVSYNGDGLQAMWNAPADQPDHATLACRAALAMQLEIPGLDENWREKIGRPLALGIGLNTGNALVGNSGSRTKFMYGAQGHAVNLASRVEGATKHLGVPILITGTTRDRLDGTLAVRRLCRVRVVGIDGTVELYELNPADDVEWEARRDAYEAGLALYESGRWSEACRNLYPLLTGKDGRYDLPTLSLVGRCIECLKAPHRPFDPVIELDHK